MTSVTAMIATTERTYFPARHTTRPLSYFSQESPSLPGLVADAAKAFAAAGSGVLALDSRAAVALGLPWRSADLPTQPKDHPAENELRDAGWNLSKLQAWTVLHAPNRPSVHLCLIDLVDGDSSGLPVITRSHLDTANALDLWHQGTGTAWFGNAGTAGIGLMRKVVRVGSGKAAKEPTWRLSYDTPPPFADAQHHDYVQGQWRSKAPAKTDRWFIGYDLNRMYLAAAGVVKLAPYTLRHTGNLPWSKDLAGLWRVRVSHWPKTLNRHLPDPAGYVAGGGEERWLTGATLELLDQLTEEGIYGGYEVLESWTCKGATELLKPWSTTLNQAILNTVVEPGAFDHAAAVLGFKGAYKRGWGMLSRETSRVSRPDWAAAIMEMARVNLWRRVRRVGDATGRWPAWIATDCLYYPAATDDAIAEAPEGITLGPGLGQFKVAGVEAIPGRGPKAKKAVAA